MSVCLIKHHAIGAVEVQLHAFLTSAVVGSEWSASGPVRFTLGKDPAVTLVRRLGNSHSRCTRHNGKEKNSLPPPGIKP